MNRFLLAASMVTTLLTACLDGNLPGAGEGVVLEPFAPGLSLHDRVDNAIGATPEESLESYRALDVEAVLPFEPPSITLDAGWRDRGGVIDELGGAQKWEHTLGSTGWDSVQQVVRFDADEVVVVGWIERGLDFGGACGQVVLGERIRDVPFLYSSYVARFNDAGACTWIDSFDSDDAWPIAVTVDAAKNIYVVGMFNTEVRFGTGFDLQTGGNAYDVFIARYDDKSELNWTHKITGTSDTWAYDAAVIEDGDGADLVLAGSFDGTAQLDASTQLTAAGGYDMLVARYSSAGALVFASAVGAEGMDEAYSVGAVGTDVVVGGYFDSATLPVGGLTPLANAGSYDAALFKLSGAGVALWAERIGGDGGDWITDLTVAGGDIAVVGAFAGAMSVAGLPELTSAGTSAFIARLTSAGAGLWSHAVTSANGGALFTSLRANTAGDLYVATLINGDASFGSTLISPAAGSWSIVAARYAAAGTETPLWASKQDRTGQMTYPVLDLSDTRVVLSADLLSNGGDMALYGLGL